MSKDKQDKDKLTQLRATLPAALEDVSQGAWEEFQALQNAQGQAFQSTKPNSDLAALRKARADAKAQAAKPIATLDQAMVLARRNNRVCPLPAQWVAFHKLLGEGVDPREVAPFALDGGAWHMVPAIQKRLRLKEQLEWAEKHGRLAAACQFLTDLPEEAWLHF